MALPQKELASAQPDFAPIRRGVLATPGPENPLQDIERNIRRQIFGQEQAIGAVIDSLYSIRQDFRGGDLRRPKRVLMFQGPTGVGKTEMARVLAGELHPGNPSPPFLKIDGSLFSTGFEVTALVGAPPMYVGREQRPMLDPDIIEKDNSIVLFDEIEKGQKELHNLMLQIMEDGEIFLINGARRVSFANSIIIITTNAGSREMGQRIGGKDIGFARQSDDPSARELQNIGIGALEQIFTPEWIGRVNDIIVFQPLSHDTLRRVLDEKILPTANDAYRRQGYTLTLEEGLTDRLLSQSRRQFGARTAKNVYSKIIDPAFAKLTLTGGIPRGSRVEAVYEPPPSRFHAKDLAPADVQFYYEPDDSLLATLAPPASPPSTNGGTYTAGIYEGAPPPTEAVSATARPQ